MLSNILYTPTSIKLLLFLSSSHSHTFVGIVTRRDGTMKFGKRLKRHTEETLPGWRDKYLSYKDLKKLVKLLSSAPLVSNGSVEFGKVEAEFVYVLNNEIDKFNTFFVEQEEDFIIRHKELRQRIKKVIDTWGTDGVRPSKLEYKQEIEKIRKDIVDLHGEMVLLENYSNVNYTGLAKILKKYDKRTGGLLRSPFIQKVFEQPFFTTDHVLSKLVKECESIIHEVFTEEKGEIFKQPEEKEAMSSVSSAPTAPGIFRNTVAALLTMKELRGGSSTYSHFSLPPLTFPDSDLVHFAQLDSPSPIPITSD